MPPCDQPDRARQQPANMLQCETHSKDETGDLPQVVIGMAVTTGGLPVRLWVWPGDTVDTTVLGEVKADLAGWQLNRTVWVVDAGITSKQNRKVLTAGGSGFIVAEKLRSSEHDVIEARGRQGRFRKVDDTPEVKDIRLGDGPSQQRLVMVRNLEAAAREAHTRNIEVTRPGAVVPYGGSGTGNDSTPGTTPHHV